MLSQTATYALLAMGFLAKHHNEGPVLTRTISSEMGIPQNFLSKIMNRLVQAGLVSSTRGTGGGFKLRESPSDVTLERVVSLFMDLQVYQRCFLGRDKCDGSCTLHEMWKPIGLQTERMLRETMIDQVL